MPTTRQVRKRGRLGLIVVIVAAALALVGGAVATTNSGASVPSIVSVQPDYGPGDLVMLAGAGWQAGESVQIVVNDDEGQSWSRTAEVVANEDGQFLDEFTLPEQFVATYSVTATGEQSGTATTSFTDQLHAEGAYVNGSNSTVVTVGPSGTVPGGLTVSGTVGWPSSETWRSTKWWIGTSSACADTIDASVANWLPKATRYFDMTAPAAPGTYNVSMLAYGNGTCSSSPANNTFSLPGKVVVDPSVLFSDYFGSALQLGVPGWEYTSGAVGVPWEMNDNFFVSFTAAGSVTKRGIDTSDRQNIHLKYTWGYAVAATLQVFWKRSSDSDSSFSLLRTDSATGVGQPATANPVDITLPPEANDTIIDIRFAGVGFPVFDGVVVTGDPPLDQAPLQVATPTEGTYGQTLQMSALGGSGGGAVSFAVDPSSTACAINGSDPTKLDITSGVGICTITATKEGDGTYKSTTSPALAVAIHPAQLTVTPDDQEMTYGGTVPTFTSTIAGYVGGDGAGVVTIQPTCGATGPFTVAGSPYQIGCSGGDAGDNYTFAYEQANLSVGPATLTVTPHDKTISFGQADPAFTFSLAGFENGESEAVLADGAGEALPVCGTTPAGPHGVGTYTITCSGGTDDNYSYDTTATATLTVQKGPQAIDFPAIALHLIDAKNTPASDVITATSKTPDTSGSPTGLLVSFTSLTPGVCFVTQPSTLDSGTGVSSITVTVKAVGLCTIEASSGATGDYEAAADVRQSFQVSRLLVMGPQAMEGDLKVANGSTLRVGYDFTIPGGHGDDLVSFRQAQVSFNWTCTVGTKTGTLVVKMTPDALDMLDPADSSGWYPSGDQHDTAVFQGSVVLGNLCPTGSLVRFQKGGTFSAAISEAAGPGNTTPTAGMDKIHVRWHYSGQKDPTTWTAGGWSGTATVVPS
jgi:MBG domain (YGX type)